MLKAISLWQPWASGIALGVKQIETRHWSTAHRGEIAIHAAKRWDVDQREFAEHERRMGTIGFGLPFGAIIAVAELVGVERSEMLVDRISEQEQRWGNYGPRRFGWQLVRPRPLAQPISCRGMQSLWGLDVDTERRVRDQLGGAA